MNRREAFRAWLTARPRLYPIPWHREEHLPAYLEQARAYVAAGCGVVQLRLKSTASGAFLEEADRWREAFAATPPWFIVNDRVDIAAMAEADGVHLGQDDLPVDVARRLLPEDAMIGFSTHTREQAEAAQDLDIDYLAIGPAYGTTTKDDPDPAVGLETIREVCRCSRVPVVAIGGITLDRLDDLLAAGVSGISVIGDLLATNDPRGRAAVYNQRLDDYSIG